MDVGSWWIVNGFLFLAINYPLSAIRSCHPEPVQEPALSGAEGVSAFLDFRLRGSDENDK
jgi:hypothetical protein